MAAILSSFHSRMSWRWDPDGSCGRGLQAGHGTHSAGMIYGRERTGGNNTIIDRRMEKTATL